MSTREITGKHVLIGTVSAFAVIIAVNLTMAAQAIGTFPGLEVKNSYVASQKFEARRDAQDALGWQTDATVGGGLLTVYIRDAEGQPVRPEHISAVLGRPTVARDDRNAELVWNGEAFETSAELSRGAWILNLDALSEDGVKFRKRISLWVR